MGDREVTREQFYKIMSFPELTGTGAYALPVTGITWHEAKEFCRLLSLKEHRTYRLPSEAQWEYACRAGTQTAFGGSGRLADMAWYQGSPGGSVLHTGGLRGANHWGLFDLHGNVAEWCEDRYLSDYPVNPTDANAPLEDPLVGGASEKMRVVRGGSFNSLADDCRSSARDKMHPSKSRSDLGFRVIMEEPAASSRP
jgi:formylglycine-generating enzyme required for sulfatase activity